MARFILPDVDSLRKGMNQGDKPLCWYYALWMVKRYMTGKDPIMKPEEGLKRWPTGPKIIDLPELAQREGLSPLTRNLNPTAKWEEAVPLRLIADTLAALKCPIWIGTRVGVTVQHALVIVGVEFQDINVRKSATLTVADPADSAPPKRDAGLSSEMTMADLELFVAQDPYAMMYIPQGAEGVTNQRGPR